ncbi:3-hydroxyacyl-CoA dehydrogenase family protein [Paenibacillus sp. Soil750]|uniref:3-hydroxyacyl-CoA dehydrogenase family protein n=1 Tax=Paenibacillus sp. Soil750 TaxID=1736398 RepID=UPI0006F5474B|nr:3-hydroxyacyl-CoA dehydrogenase NAD-binding domain-containing protein [Paenibacillus sp. Soil750]KRE70470.1 3-hydroxybutyryl-CoA dehydrogenase [Paenibacillus sp. Soil750]
MDIKKVGVIGAGTMGRGISELLAAKGIDVYLMDKSPEKLNDGLRLLDASLNKQIERWALTHQEKKQITAKIIPISDVQMLLECDMIIEAVSEQLDVKKQLFCNLENSIRPDAILASNTATLSLTELAEAMEHKERVIGLHFLFPAGQVRLVEIVRGLKTSDLTFQITKQFVEQTLDKASIQVYESPGYVTTRIICTLINEALHTLSEGVAKATDIDEAIRIGYGFHYGPLEMADRFGLDSVLASMETLFHELGDIKYRPNVLLKKMVRARQLGLKTGKGFFHYNEGGDRI